MCLLTNCKKKSVAKKPIRCLKVVAVLIMPGVGPVYRSFYAFNGSVEYKIGGTVDMNEGRTEAAKDKLRTLPSKWYNEGPYEGLLNDKSSFEYRVEAGIHAFSPKGNGARSVYEWGKKEIERYRNYSEYLINRNDVAILECEIPVGAEYYKGISTCFSERHQVDENGYTSDKLHIIRALSEEEIKALPYVDVPC